ncbi:protein eyes shut [Copidosoma floridanum]|uniref:protein eyes shut n=1 Tax=Copidosoma floridanum TaxID=29053 RepID=UPI0006C9A044|nr:protein eyes shut [Copidosoma floridanum]
MLGISKECYSSKWHKCIAVISITLALAAPTGSNCSSNPCMYGICVDDPNSSYQCYCIDGYTGINCEINWDDCWSHPCANGGTCNDAIATYNCTCLDGFVGLNCEQRYSECMNEPCLNNATCLDHNGFTCQCLEGFIGEFCEIDVEVCNETTCKNAGECVDGPGLEFACLCPDGWTGPYCEEDVNECANGSPCQNGGLCINEPGTFTCACLFGYTGRECAKVIVPCADNPCQNRAVCLLEDTQPTCYCVPDYHGSLCELRYDDCESKNARCDNGGTCVDGVNNFTCSCPPPYAGDMCTVLLHLAETTTSYDDLATPSFGTDDPGQLTSLTDRYYTDTSFEPSAATTEELFETTEPVESSSVGVDGGLSTTPVDEDLGFVTGFQIGGGKHHGTRTSVEATNATSESTERVFTLDGDEVFSLAASVSTGGSASEGFPTTPIVLEVTKKTTTSEPYWRSSSVSDYDETANTSNEPYSTDTPGDGGGNATEGSTVIQHVTMLSSTIYVEDNATRDSSTGSPTYSAASSDLTTLVDFLQTNFVTDYGITEEDTGAPAYTTGAPTTTTEPGLVYNCDRDQCNNVTLCMYNGTRCDCSYPGNCRKRSSIRNAAFSGKSYVRQKFTVDDGLLNVSVRLRTRAKSGILVHALFDDERYILLYVEAGQLKFQFSCGLQTMLFGELDSPINNGFEVDVEIRFHYIVEAVSDKCLARLLVNSSVVMSGEQVLQVHGTMPQYARLHLGGIPVAFTQQFPQIVLGFVGCMSSFKMNGMERDFIYDSVEAVQIEECDSFLCLSSPCKNFGACQEVEGKVKCKCIAGYSGETCEKSVCDDNPCRLGATCLISPGANFICVCPLGTHGLYCEKDATIYQPSFSVFSPGLSSYMAYGISTSLKDHMELKLRIVPQTLDQISLIAYMGQTGAKPDTSDHFSLTYVRGYIMLTWDLGSGVRRIFTDSPLNVRPHRVHTIRIGRRGRDSWFHVDGMGNVTGRAAGTNTRLDVSPILYIGGHKSRYFETLPHDLPLHTGFSGCIYDIELKTDDNVFPLTMSSPATGRGVGECHRNECSHNSCKNGAVCLNYGPTYSCICMKDWEGPDCSTPANCSLSESLCHKDNN